MVSAAKLSILIPTYNRSGFLSECLDSLLAQNCTNYELLIRDNDSVDDTKDVVETYKAKFSLLGVSIKYKKNPTNVGFRDNMVEGLKELTNQYAIILMDDDFLISSQGVSSLYLSIIENEGVVFANAGVKVCHGADKIDITEETPANAEIIAGDDYFLNAWTRYKPLVLSTVMFDRSVLLDSEWEFWSQRAALDVNLYNIMSLKGDVALFHCEFLAYRVHDQQDFCSIPIEDAFESHSRILNWYKLALESGKFTKVQLFFWWIKTVILKDEGIVVRLAKRNSYVLDDYFLFLKNYRLAHFLLINLFMPCVIRMDRKKYEKKNAVLRGFLSTIANGRRLCLRTLLHTHRSLSDTQYQLNFLTALRGNK